MNIEESQYMLDLSDQMLRHVARHAPLEAIEAHLNAMAADLGEGPFGRRVAREIVDRTRPQQAVPEAYAPYKPVVRDGIEFFLSRVSRPRLVELVASQLKLPPDTAAQERLLELAKRFPTLHKLGQTIARNPGLDPQVKRWLVHLENGRYGTPLEHMLERIGDIEKTTGESGRLRVEPAILAEASVGAVLPFQWRAPNTDTPVRGVFKILKPGIRRRVREELAILAETARFFENHRERYPLKNLQLLDLFREVRERLVREIDMRAEQGYLDEATRFYGALPGIEIPERLPLGTNAVTAMTYLEGPKITDAELQPADRRQCAARLFETLVCKPLFSRRQASLFHGDPHAGNILAVKDAASDHLRIGLVDWSLAGHLVKGDRIRAAQLIQAVFKNDLNGIRRSVIALHQGPQLDTHRRRQFRRRALRLMRRSDYAGRPLLGRTFKLLEHLALEGFVFPANLMLFGKAIFTLEGVLYDLWPRFDMDAAVISHLATLMTHEIPDRLRGFLAPFTDRPENYPSLISNLELHGLMVHHYFATLRSSSSSFQRYWTAWGQLFGMHLGLVPAPISAKDVVKQ